MFFTQMISLTMLQARQIEHSSKPWLVCSTTFLKVAKEKVFQSCSHQIHSLIVCFPFVHSSIGFCHGEGRCPWRAAQQEIFFNG